MNKDVEVADAAARGSAWHVAVEYAVLYLVFWQIAPRLRDERLLTIVAATLVSLVLVVLTTAASARAVQSTRAALVLALVAAICVVPLKVLYASGRLAVPWSWLLAVPGASELAFVLFGTAVGVLLSRLLRSANMVPPAAAALALVDIWTVLLGGPVQRIMTSTSEQARRAAEAMTVRLPAPTTGAAPMAVVGFADFVFIAFFIAAMCRFAGDEVGYGRTVRPLVIVLALYMLAVLVTGLSLPALVPMAAVVLVVHWRRFHYERSELFALMYAGLIAVAALAAVVWLTRR